MDDYLLEDEDGVAYPITARYFFLSSAFNESSGSKPKSTYNRPYRLR